MDKKPDEIYCPNCAKPIKKDAIVCPYCGEQAKEFKVSDKIGESKYENIIAINRRRFFDGALAKFYIYMDGVEIGNIGNGERKEFKTTASGQHGLVVKTKLGILGIQSEPLIINLINNEIIELSCGINRGFFKNSIFLIEKSRKRKA